METTSQKIRQGLEHVKIHLETSGRFGDRLAPIERSLTQIGMAAIMPRLELQRRAENILKHHGLLGPGKELPKSAQGDSQQCLLASVTGIRIESYEGIMDLRFLSAWERILLTEFVQRFDMGEYPELTQPPIQHTREHGKLD